jgi:DNA polymerase lambda
MCQENFLFIHSVTYSTIQILKHGGTITPTYDPQLNTHIITEAGEEKTRRTLGLRHIQDIPDHIPTVKWNYVLSCRPNTNLSRMEFMHASFSCRMEAGRDWKATRGNEGRSKGKGKAVVMDNRSDGGGGGAAAAAAAPRNEQDGEVSRIE